MNDSTTVSRDFYVTIDDLIVTAIQSLGEYDSITRREFETEAEAIGFYQNLGGIIHGETNDFRL